MKYSTGFSLIELLVVLVVMGVIASLVPHGLNLLYRQTSADSSAHALAAQLRDCGLRALQLQHQQLASTAPTADCVLEVPQNVELGYASDSEPVFYADGSSNGSSLVVSHAHQQFVILINRITSSVSVQPNAAE